MLSINAASTFVMGIEYTNPGTQRTFSGFMERDVSGFTLKWGNLEQQRIGHRKRWQDALRDALIMAEEKTRENT